MAGIPDPKWLEILKASGWQTAAIACACGGLLVLARWGIIPPLEPWMVIAATFVLLVTSFLTIASAITAFLKFVPVQTWAVHAFNQYRIQRAIRDYIPHMTERERKIIAYLLAHNQKMFTAAQDAGYATTLQSRGIVVMALRPGQIFSGDDMPMAIPDDVWKVLKSEERQFPITDVEKDGPHPWRVPWMAR